MPSFFETSRPALKPLSSLRLRSFASTSRSSPPSLSQLEHLANLHPHDPSHQSLYLHHLSSVDPLSVVRRVESGRFATSGEVMLEYEKAKNKLDAQHMQQQQQHTYSPHTSPSPSHGHAYYGTPSSYPPSSYPPPSSYSSYPSAPSSYPPSPALGSATHPLSVSIIKEPDVTPPRSFFVRLVSGLGRLLPVFVILGAAMMLAPGGAGGSPFMPRSPVKEWKADGDVPKVLFSDVKGCDEAKAELEEIVAYLRNPSHFEKLGGKMVKGVLLTGPPGTGKTLLAKAIAGEAHVPFFSVQRAATSRRCSWAWARRRIRDLFTAAQARSRRALIFIDEIDARRLQALGPRPAGGAPLPQSAAGGDGRLRQDATESSS